MKKAAIITLVGNNNYGNRLQNYAVQEVLKRKKFDSETIINEYQNYNFIYIIKHIIKLFIRPRYKNFCNFDKRIKFAKRKINLNKKLPNILNNYNYYIAGSDQIWNPSFGRMNDFDLLTFTKSKNKIAFSASFGIDNVPKDKKEYLKNNLESFKAISVREDAGKKIIENLTKRKDVEVLVDPTMLITKEEWQKVSKRPKNMINKKYILNYFLGNYPQEYKEEIEKIANENDCEIINLLDKKSPFYQSGPSEFLYLEENAFLICTDSFHASVFAIIFNRPFIVFDRQYDGKNMNSRLDTLLSKFKLEKRKFTGKITKEMLKNDYEEAFLILKEEQKKSNDFLDKALDIK